MNSYSRVSYGTRCQIFALLQTNLSVPKIATILGFDKSTIYRELKRNSDRGGKYCADKANQRSKRRYKVSRSNSSTLAHQHLIVDLLKRGLSPEQICGRIRREQGSGPCHESIYRFVYKNGYKAYLRRYNKRGAGRYIQRRRLRKLKFGHPIELRPEIVNTRRRIGDWERDTMHTKEGVQLLVCIDRKSRFIKIAKVSDRRGQAIAELSEKLISATGKRAYTITNDNGGDFKGIKKSKIKTFYCTPLRPDQRGSVENVIGLIRQYITRKTDIRNWSKKDIRKIEGKLNNRPRKILGYKTPFEVYFNEKVALVG